MKTVVGIRLRPCGKVTYYDPQDLDIRLDDGVIIDTPKGEEFAVVTLARSELPDELVPYDPEPIVRVADSEDWDIHEELLQREKEAHAVFVEKVREHELNMKLVDVECSFDGTRIIFYFSADGRVDFRDLVRDLAAELHMRIELRQIGVRDETRMLGGMGPCGRPLCCNLYLREFAPVTIKMAKSQNLSLNPSKISGCCGRLMCCLRNEADTYEEMSKALPKRGTVVTTNDGFVGVTVDSNILAQTVRVIVDLDNDEKEVREYSLDQLKFTPGVKRPVRKADQRPVVRSVVAQAAQAEVKRQEQLKEEARAEEEARKQADGEEHAGAPAEEGGSRRRRRSRRRRGGGEGGGQREAANAGQRENDGAQRRTENAGHREDDGGERSQGSGSGHRENSGGERRGHANARQRGNDGSERADRGSGRRENDGGGQRENSGGERGRRSRRRGKDTNNARSDRQETDPASRSRDRSGRDGSESSNSGGRENGAGRSNSRRRGNRARNENGQSGERGGQRAAAAGEERSESASRRSRFRKFRGSSSSDGNSGGSGSGHTAGPSSDDQ